MTAPLDPAERAEWAGRAEAVATLAAMREALVSHGQSEEPSHPAHLLTDLLCQIADCDGPHPGRFIAGVSVILCPWLLHGVKGAGRSEAIATAAAMQSALVLHQQGKSSHPALLLTSLLCQIANTEAPDPKRFISDVAAILSPWLTLALKEAGGSE